MAKTYAWVRHWALAAPILLLALWIAAPLGLNRPAMQSSEFDAPRAHHRLAAILREERPHTVDSAAGDVVHDRLTAQIRAIGFTPLTRDVFHCSDHWPTAAVCGRVRNLAFWVTEPGNNAVMLLAHYDSVAAGPGVTDDGIGIATALEVAAVLKGQRLGRPLLVVFTDGEEAGMIGASAFAKKDPLARAVSAVVNVEARGTTGPPIMFQTSRPNGRDTAALSRGGVGFGGNSLYASVYEALPNDTDLSVLLPLGVDAANYAVIGASARYHTPLDDLDHLDLRSLSDMGSEVLAAVRGFAAGGEGGAEGQRIFAGIGMGGLLSLSLLGAYLLVGLGLVGAVVLFLRSASAFRIRTIVAPLAAIALGTPLAVGCAYLLGHPGGQAGAAPASATAVRAAIASSALLGAALALYWLRIRGGVALAAAAWVTLAAFAAAAMIALPDVANLAAWPLLLILLAAIATFLLRREVTVPALLMVAALIFLLLTLPFATLVEDALGAAAAGPLVIFLLLLFLFLMPVSEERTLRPALACALILLVSGAAAFLLAPHTAAAPRQLNLVHRDDNGASTVQILNNGPVPAAMAQLLKFGASPNAFGSWEAAAPRIDSGSRFSILSGETKDGKRRIALQFTSPGADMQELDIKGAEHVSSLSVEGQPLSHARAPGYVACSGRSCRTLDLEITLKAGAPLPTLRWTQTRYGHSATTRSLAARRPAEAQPVHAGDRLIWARDLTLDKPTGPAPAPGDR